MNGTIISLKNSKVVQASGDTLNLSGNTDIYGGLSIKSGGTFTIADNAGVGNVLTSDALGNITLQSPSGGGVTGVTNGLSLVSGGTAVSLGGVLTGDTEINLNSKNLKILDEIIGFNTGSGFNGETYSIAIQSDGKILVGGEFTTYSGVTANKIIRLNSNGSIDNAFNSGGGFNNYVNSISIQSDGKILCCGWFTTYSGVTANRIIRLNVDGSIDNTFNSGGGFNNYVNSISIQSNGKILVGGDFTAYSGVTANRIIRLNVDGSIDASFVTGTGFDSHVYSISIQSDGKILVGGLFTEYSGTTANNIIRLNNDGNIDNTFATGTGLVDGIVHSIAIQIDEKILVGGEFTTYSEVTANRIIRLNSDGNIDNTFATGTGFDIAVRSIAIQSDDKILCGGYFSLYSGVTANRIIRLKNDGSVDNTFVTGSGFDYGSLSSIAIQSDGKILVGGNFTSYSGVTVNNIVRLNSDGSIFDKIGMTININGVKLEGNLGFYGTSPVSKPVVSGSTGGNLALISLISKLSALNLISDNTTA